MIEPLMRRQFWQQGKNNSNNATKDCSQQLTASQFQGQLVLHELFPITLIFWSTLPKTATDHNHFSLILEKNLNLPVTKSDKA